jgi:hypothetical protein
MKATHIFVPVRTGVIITEECHVVVNSEELNKLLRIQINAFWFYGYNFIIYDFIRGVITTHYKYICILALNTLKMAE